MHWQSLVRGAGAKHASQQRGRREFPLPRMQNDLRRLCKKKLGHRRATRVLGRILFPLPFAFCLQSAAVAGREAVG